MSTNKAIDKICLVAVVVALLITTVFINGETIQAAGRTMGYEQRLFDTDTVHSIDIVMDNWDSFIETCENEEYAACTVVIDGEAYGNVGIRAKGNTSLSSVSSMDSDRYSFKIEFDQYENGKSYYGLDKLSLNNLIQDNTYMKDYFTYTLMNSFGATAPLCSYVQITVNGEDWGLYLAVEGVEDSFLQRNYGSDYGELYKPDSMSFGGGRGNGRDFDMNELLETADEKTVRNEENVAQEPGNTGRFDPSIMFEGELELPEDFDPSAVFGGDMELPEGFDPSAMFDGNAKRPEALEAGGFKGMGGMGSSDVKLQYTDDESESYTNIFDNAKTDITEADQTRLIAALKKLSEGESIDSVVDVEAVLRYFVVHNFVVNGDSYTGSIVHNYYLYEEDGKLTMLPWDYNLAYGTFQGNDAESAVNDPIDSPLSVSDSGDRPMAEWIFADEEYTARYHQYFAAFLEQTDFAALIDKTADLIAPYVERDPSKFCTYEEFTSGVAALRQFCLLREESVLGQLEGSIPSTDEGQAADSATLVDASGLTLSDMGSMGNTMGGGFDGGRDRADRTQGGGMDRNERWKQGGQEMEETPVQLVPEQNETVNISGGRGGLPASAMGTEKTGSPNSGERDVTVPEPPVGTAEKNANNNIMLLVGSVLMLLVGLVVAKLYKR